MTHEEYRLLALECVVAATINPSEEGGIATAAREIADGCIINGAFRDKEGFEIKHLQSYVSHLIKGDFRGP